jgi:hypothetical protein
LDTRSAARAARDPNQYAPVFVLATARSYSSVASTMIGQHPRLYGFPELKLFACPTIGDLEASLRPTSRTPEFGHRSPGLVRALAQLMWSDQSPRALANAQRWLSERGDFSGAEVFDMMMAYAWPRVAVEKSPEHALFPVALRRLVDAYPRARFIHLTRHPVTTAASIQQHMELTDEHATIFSFYSWYEINYRLVELGAQVGSDRYLHVRAEDMLNEPRCHLPAIARWLGVDDGELAIEAMQHPEASPFACFGPPGSGVVGGNAREFLSDPVPRRVTCPATVEQPAGWNGPASLWSAVLELAATLGYTAPIEVTPSAAGRGNHAASRRSG